MIIDVYLLNKCEMCNEMKRILAGKPDIVRKATKVRVYEVDKGKSERRNVINSEKDNLPNLITIFPSVVITEGSISRVLTGDDALQLMEYGAVNAGNTLRKLCPYRRMKKCAGDKCQKYVILKMEGFIPAAYCSDTWNTDLLASIGKRLSNIEKRMEIWDLQKKQA